MVDKIFWLSFIKTIEVGTNNQSEMSNLIMPDNFCKAVKMILMSSTMFYPLFHSIIAVGWKRTYRVTDNTLSILLVASRGMFAGEVESTTIKLFKYSIAVMFRTEAGAAKARAILELLMKSECYTITVFLLPTSAEDLGSIDIDDWKGW